MCAEMVCDKPVFSIYSHVEVKDIFGPKLLSEVVMNIVVDAVLV